MPAIFIADVFTFAGRAVGVIGIAVLLFAGLAAAIPWFLWSIGLHAISMVYCISINLVWRWRKPGGKRKCCRKCAARASIH